MRAKISLVLIAALLAAVAAPIAVATAQESETASQTVKVFKGKVTYRIYCSNCHGETGHGDGNLAELLSVKPADLTAIARNNGGTFPTEQITKLVDGREAVKGHGRKEMPVWGDAFQKSLQPSWTEESDDDRARRKIDEVVAFVKSIQELEEPAG
ncbi:MAG: c-type cytochrome [Thermoanaerobaculia bacterium]